MKEWQPVLSGVSHVHHQGAQVTDKNLIKPEHPGWCDSTGWTWGRSCLCPKPEPVPSSLCHRAEPGSPAQQSRSRAGPGCSDKTFSLLPLLPPTTSPAPVIAVCWRRVVLVAGCARCPCGMSQQRRMSVSACRCVWTAYKGLCELAGGCLRNVRWRQC